MFMTKASLLCSTFVAGFIGFSDASWHMSCSIIQTGRLDPILSPGKVSTYVNKIVGGSNIGLSSNFDDLQASSCTSCEIPADKSAYWTPLLYYQHSNGSFEEVHAPDGIAIYYLGYGNDTTDIKPFPKNLVLVSGDMLARGENAIAMTYKNTRPIAERVSFTCLDDIQRPATNGLSEVQCKNGLRAKIHFQSCWNGKDLYKANFAHVDYLSGIDNGECSPDYPVRLMHVYFEVLYSVADIKQDGGRFVFANGDPTGYGFHGEIISGWNNDVFTSAIAGCGVNNLNPSGVVNSCPAFSLSNTNHYTQFCPEQQPLVNEKAHGLIDKLPGCITITDGPEEATPADISCPAIQAQPSLNQGVPGANYSGPVAATNDIVACDNATGSSDSASIAVASSASVSVSLAATASFSAVASVLNVINGYVTMGCYLDLIDGVRSLNATRYIDTVKMTVDFCTAYCSKKGFQLAGVEFHTNSPKADPTDCNMPCKGDATEICGGPARLNVYLSG